MEYELLFFTSLANEDKIDSIKKDLTKILESSGAKMVSDFTDIGKRKLAYPIKRDTHAFYSFVRFVLEGEKRNDIGEINRRISLSDKIIRHLIVRADEIGKPISQTQESFGEKTLPKEKELEKKDVSEKPEVKKSKATINELDEKLTEILEEAPG